MNTITFQNFKTKELITFEDVKSIHIHQDGETFESNIPKDVLIGYKPGQTFSIWTKGNSAETVLGKEWSPKKVL